MTDRNLSTTRQQVFGDIGRGTECRICGRPVDDHRAKICSDYCDNIQRAVMGLLNWSSVRRRIIDRDDETCQQCGYDRSRRRRARDHIQNRIDERLPPKPKTPSALNLGRGEAEDFDWDQHRDDREKWEAKRDALQDRYGDPYDHDRSLEVDHIQPIAEGGHPFDPANLQTLCEDCHYEKTGRENSERGQTPSRGDLSESILEYIRGTGGPDA